jgi:hypothetical protein
MFGSAAIAVIAAFTFVASCFYTARAFSAAQRPVIGIVSHSVRTFGEPPTDLHWRFVVRNLGALPGRLRIRAYTRRIYGDDGMNHERLMPPLPAGASRTAVIMPGQESTIEGSVTDLDFRHLDLPVVRRILTGSLNLDVFIDLAYDGPATLVGRRRFFHWSVQRFNLEAALPAFGPIAADAN